MIIHIMEDGTVRKSVEGVVIKNEQFYRIFNAIQEKHKRELETKRQIN